MYYYAHGIAPSGANGVKISIPASAGGGSDGRFGIGSSHSFTNEQLVLTMPAGHTVHNIGHLVVWCEAFNVFFNEPLQFPAAGSIVFESPTEPPTTPTEPPTTPTEPPTTPTEPPTTPTVPPTTPTEPPTTPTEPPTTPTEPPTTPTEPPTTPTEPPTTPTEPPTTPTVPPTTPTVPPTTPTEPPTEVIVTILPLQIGSFTNTQHAVAGTVYANNNSTIRIENFHYDGLGPGELILVVLVSLIPFYFPTAAYMYYYAKGVTPSGSNGVIIPIPASVGGGSDGRFGIGSSHSFSNEQLVLTMPEGSTVHGIGHLVIWCEAFKVFFNSPMQFPDPLATNITTVIVNTTTATPTEPPTTPTEPPTEVIATILPLQIGSLQTLNMLLLVQCTLTTIPPSELRIFITTSMDNGDVTIAWVNNKTHAEDYFLQATSPRNSVCIA